MRIRRAMLKRVIGDGMELVDEVQFSFFLDLYVLEKVSQFFGQCLKHDGF